jgi:serine/threonine protein kinase
MNRSGICGTPTFMAPEVVHGEWYGLAAGSRRTVGAR